MVTIVAIAAKQSKYCLAKDFVCRILGLSLSLSFISTCFVNKYSVRAKQHQQFDLKEPNARFSIHSKIVDSSIEFEKETNELCWRLGRTKRERKIGKNH